VSSQAPPQPREEDPAALRDALEAAREAVRAGEERVRNLIENNADGIVIVDAAGNVMFVNPACEKLLGRPASHLLGQPFGFPCVAGSTAEIDILRPGGPPAAAEMRVVDTHWEGRPACLASLRDITHRKALEEQLRQSQKMEAIGRLAGGIAHDFNNILTAIAGYADLALARLDGKVDGNADLVGGLRGDVSEIKEAAARAGAVTRQLLTFSRKHLTQTEVLDLRDVVSAMEGMLRRVIGDSVELFVARGPVPCRVKADRGQVEQVILNLGVNARDAMPEGGRLTIGTCDVAGGHCGAQAAGGPEGDYVLLTVSDTGRGIDPAVLPRIFEPFFTTKGPDCGTGLGLSIVYSIVQQCGGHVLVDSEPGRGTRFRIFLPRVNVADVQPPKPRPAAVQGSGGATILLVEDRDDVRIVTRRMLQRCGYTVLEAADAAAALALHERHHGPVQLLITDVVMPGMSGRELAERVGPQRPDMKILFMSGFTRDEILPDGGEGTNKSFLQKPFTLDQLLTRVAEMIGSSPQPAAGDAPGQHSPRSALSNA
jgi:signal transduction histidine kinase/CheY-like chemotaxis protein